MRKSHLFLVLVLLWFSSARAQVMTPARADSITHSLDQQFPGGPPSDLQRVQLVRQQLEDAVLEQKLRQVPLLLDYLARVVPESAPTVQPREAMSLLLAAGAYGPLLKRVLADKSEQAQRRYRQALLLIPGSLGDMADFCIATHAENLKAQTQKLPTEEAVFIQLLVEVLPRGGVSPAIDSTIQRFRQQYTESPYAYVLKAFQTQEQVKGQLRQWHVRADKVRSGSCAGSGSSRLGLRSIRKRTRAWGTVCISMAA